MKNLKTNKIIVTLAIILAIVLGLTVNSFAEEQIQAINPSDVVGGSSSSTSAKDNATNTNKVNTVNTANTNKVNNVNSSSSYNNTNLPSTGLEDYSPLFIVAGALVVVAIVAYKKANYYKDI